MIERDWIDPPLTKPCCCDRPYVPERDLFRLLKYGTYDILTLEMYTPELVPEDELTDEELELVRQFYEGEGTLTFEEAFNGKDEL